MRKLGKMLVSALLISTAGIASAAATESSLIVYRPSQGLTHSFGSKIAVGYFMQKDGACALNIFLTESPNGDVPLPASRLQVRVAPGENLKLTSGEGQALEIKCGDQAGTLEVRHGSSGRIVSR